MSDANWPRASAWLGGESLPETVGSLAVLGVPLNKSITPGRCDLAPQAIRKSMHRLSTYDIDRNTDVRRLSCHDLGDLKVEKSSPEDALEPIRLGVLHAIEDHSRLVILGGDNGVTRPGVHGLGVPIERSGLITLDAHLDMRHRNEGLHNGNPVRALLDDGLPGGNIVQIGLSSFANSAEYARDAHEAGIQVVPMAKVREIGVGQAVTDALDRLDYRTDAIYFDLDVDVLDRAFAPACPGARPGGLAPQDAMLAAWLAGRHKKVRAIDLVEVDPKADINESTCLCAGMLLMAFASGIVERLTG